MNSFEKELVENVRNMSDEALVEAIKDHLDKLLRPEIPKMVPLPAAKPVRCNIFSNTGTVEHIRGKRCLLFIHPKHEEFLAFKAWGRWVIQDAASKRQKTKPWFRLKRGNGSLHEVRRLAERLLNRMGKEGPT